LIASTRAGQVISVDPVLGTRVVASEVGEAAVLAVHPDRKRYLLFNRQGGWHVGTMRGEILQKGKHDFLGGMCGFFVGEYVIAAGDRADGRYLLVIHEGKLKSRARIHPRVVPVLSKGNKLLLARSVASGLVVVPFGRKARFPKGDSTGHRLMSCGAYVLGFTSTGVCVWTQVGGAPRSMRLPDLTAGNISADGRFLGLGTRGGAVALARMDRIDKRVRPDLVRAFESPVTSVAFSDRGRWLATAAEGLRLWSWED
jgi:hypothetical protein